MSELADFDNFYGEEIIDGKIHLMAPAPASYHVRIMDRLYLSFGNYLNGKNSIVSTDSLAVYYEGTKSKNYVKADLSVVCDENKFSERGYEGVPELIIEILSPSTRKYDKTTKFNLYERIGVKEYWIVEPKAKSIEQYILKDGTYKLLEIVTVISNWEFDTLPIEKQQIYKTVIKPTIFDDLEIDIKNIFNFKF